MLEIKQFAFGPFGVNTYIIYDTETLEAIVVDPGMNTDNENQRFDKFITDKKLTVTQIVNTHLHIDHCLGDNYVKDKYGARISAHIDDAFLGDNIQAQAEMFGLRPLDSREVTIDIHLKGGDIITIGKHRITVLHVPGHSPGGIALYCAESNFVIAGDSLFRGSIGRTDLPGGNYPTLVKAIKERLITLPDTTLVLPGHDMSTNISFEKANNSFLK